MTDSASDARRIGFGGPASMRELLLSLPVAYVAGPDLVFEFANENYYRAVGRRDLIGRPYAEMLAEVVVGQPQYKAAVFRVLRTGEPRGRREEVWVRGEDAEPERPLRSRPRRLRFSHPANLRG